MTILHAYINRYRGRHSKLVAYAMFAALFLGPLVAIHWNYPLWQWGAIAAAYALHICILFQWFWGSEYWPSLGKQGDLKKLTNLWRWKGIAAFALLGAALLDPVTACIGFLMAKAGKIYFRELTPEMTDSIARAEYRVGMLYGYLTLVPLAVAAIKRGFGL